MAGAIPNCDLDSDLLLCYGCVFRLLVLLYVHVKNVNSAMKDQEKIELIHAAIKKAIEDLPFTFDDLSVELLRDRNQNEIIIKFHFNEFGNSYKVNGPEPQWRFV